MIFFSTRTVTILSVLIASHLDGIGAESTIRGGSFERMLVEASVEEPPATNATKAPIKQRGWCPSDLPDSGDTCTLPTGASGGTCSYREGKDGKLTESACRCELPIELFECESKVSKKDVESLSWCPSKKPDTGDKCALPAKKSGGSCFYVKKKSSGVTTTTECSCKSGNKKFTCITTKKS
eukprot:jgi/Psemu1/28824/gm1.28824_g